MSADTKAAIRQLLRSMACTKRRLRKIFAEQRKAANLTRLNEQNI